MFRESGDHVKATEGRVSSKEWIVSLSFVHSQEQAEGIPFLYCLWDVGVDRMAFCGESHRQGAALARNKPASHSCQSQNSDCAGDLGMTDSCERPPFCSQAPGKSKAPHLGAGSLQNTPQIQQDLYFQQKYMGSSYNPKLL